MAKREIGRAEIERQIGIAMAWLSKDPSVGRDMSLAKRASLAHRILDELLAKMAGKEAA